MSFQSSGAVDRFRITRANYLRRHELRRRKQLNGTSHAKVKRDEIPLAKGESERYIHVDISLQEDTRISGNADGNH